MRPIVEKCIKKRKSNQIISLAFHSYSVSVGSFFLPDLEAHTKSLLYSTLANIK